MRAGPPSLLLLSGVLAFVAPVVCGCGARTVEPGAARADEDGVPPPPPASGARFDGLGRDLPEPFGGASGRGWAELPPLPTRLVIENRSGMTIYTNGIGATNCYSVDFAAAYPRVPWDGTPTEQIDP